MPGPFSDTCLHLLVVAMICLLVAMAPGLRAQNRVRIDATAPVPPPKPVAAPVDFNRSPNGDVIGVNSQYLTMNGRPWLPVMGEFHFSRYPDAEWEDEILKMKAAGVQIISTYVIWIYHEQNQGVFDWSGQRDLRKFVQLCGKHGMYVFPRIGPWVHGETRNGGLPDWVLKNSPVRQNNPVYLREAGTFYAQIAQQLNGLLWKNGGPVIGIQIENEYHERGPGKGPEHIRALKQMAIADGLDVPLYTVTGWDGVSIPLDAVLPVFGGYPAEPWSGSAKKLSPSEVYAFRFTNRAAGSMGAIASSGQNAASSYRGTPFLTAEVGSGIEDTYFRRPVVSADDIAAIAPVLLGSGVNLLGYYMFHGGRNPEGGAITLQESQRTGYPTDVPVKSYDFQAPLGEFGQERESLRKLKLINYFLSDFGGMLAPMSPRAPAELPASPSDTSVSRVAARTRGDQGFIFFNNHVRGVTMPRYPGFQVELQLPSGVVQVPETPVDLPSGSYGIWPVNLDLGGTVLRYSTAQLFKRVRLANQTYYFFFAIPGIQPEFVLDSRARFIDLPNSIQKMFVKAGVRLRIRPSSETEVHLAGGLTLVLLPESRAQQIWDGNDPSLLLSTAADAFTNGRGWTLQSDGNPVFNFGIFGTNKPPLVNGGVPSKRAQSLLFAGYTVSVPAIQLDAKVIKVHSAAPRAPWLSGAKLPLRPQLIPLAPDDKDFRDAAVWNVDLPAIGPSSTISDVFLRIRYQGDVARLYRQGHRIDDNFWNGLPWEIGMREVEPAWRQQDNALQLRILSMPRTFPMYLEKAGELHFTRGYAGTLDSVKVVPQYQIVLQMPASR